MSDRPISEHSECEVTAVVCVCWKQLGVNPECPLHGEAARIGRQLGELDVRVEEELMAGTMTRADLILVHQELCQEALEVLQRKNQGYATSSDPFRNFRMFGGLGILVRLSDKLARLRNVEEGLSEGLSDESVRDSVLDAINYAILYWAYRKSLGEPQNKT
jgi:hypothetical protein